MAEICGDARLLVEQERCDPGLDEVHHVLLGHSHTLQRLSRVTFGQGAASVLELLKELVSLLGLLGCDRSSHRESFGIQDHPLQRPEITEGREKGEGKEERTSTSLSRSDFCEERREGRSAIERAHVTPVHVPLVSSTESALRDFPTRVRTLDHAATARSIVQQRREEREKKSHHAILSLITTEITTDHTDRT